MNSYVLLPLLAYLSLTKLLMEAHNHYNLKYTSMLLVALC